LSSEAIATPQATATIPGVPTGLTATPGSTQVLLTWVAPAGNGGSAITGYNVYRSLTSGTETLLVNLGVVLTYTNTGLTNGQIYYFQVTSVNIIGESTRSTETSATPRTVPGAPTGLTVSISTVQLLLTWVAPASNGGSVITGYDVYRGTTSGGEVLLATLGNVLTYTTGLPPNGQAYYFQVSAINAAGEGARTAEASTLRPSATFTANATTINQGQYVRFTHTGSNGNLPATYQWSFGDGSSNATTENVTHRFTTQGTFKVTLTVVDAKGKVATYQMSIQVKKSKAWLETQDGITTISLVIFSGGIVAVVGAVAVRRKKVAVSASTKKAKGKVKSRGSYIDTSTTTSSDAVPSKTAEAITTKKELPSSNIDTPAIQEKPAEINARDETVEKVASQSRMEQSIIDDEPRIVQEVTPTLNLASLFCQVCNSPYSIPGSGITGPVSCPTCHHDLAGIAKCPSCGKPIGIKLDDYIHHHGFQFHCPGCKMALLL
jgi:PKD repeat protein